mgnify:CR=1 FL=1
MRCESPDVTFIKIYKFVTGFKFQGSAKARCLLGLPFGSAHHASDDKGEGEGGGGGRVIRRTLDKPLCRRILKDIKNLKCEEKSLVLKTEDSATKPEELIVEFLTGKI